LFIKCLIKEQIKCDLPLIRLFWLAWLLRMKGMRSSVLLKMCFLLNHSPWQLNETIQSFGFLLTGRFLACTVVVK